MTFFITAPYKYSYVRYDLLIRSVVRAVKCLKYVVSCILAADNKQFRTIFNIDVNFNSLSVTVLKSQNRKGCHSTRNLRVALLSFIIILFYSTSLFSLRVS